MTLVDVFHITGRGVVVTGPVLEGTISPGDEIVLGDTVYYVTGVESYWQPVKVGDNVGLLLRGAEKDVISQYLGSEIILHI